MPVASNRQASESHHEKDFKSSDGEMSKDSRGLSPVILANIYTNIIWLRPSALECSLYAREYDEGSKEEAAKVGDGLSVVSRLISSQKPWDHEVQFLFALNR